MTSDEAERIAAEKLPCRTISRVCQWNGSEPLPGHWYECPASFRPILRDAILDAYAEGERARVTCDTHGDPGGAACAECLREAKGLRDASRKGKA